MRGIVIVLMLMLVLVLSFLFEWVFCYLQLCVHFKFVKCYFLCSNACINAALVIVSFNWF